MNKKIGTQNSVICKNENSLFRYFGWPSVAKLPDGTLAMVASGFRLSHVCPFGKTVICYSRNGGRTWTAPAVLIDTPLDDRDSGIVTYGENKVMVTTFNNSVRFQRDCIAKYPGHPMAELIRGYLSCVNEKEAEEAFLGSLYTVSEDGGYTFGKLHKVPVQSIHGPCEMNDGRLLYVGRRFEDGKYGDEIVCYRQNDSGEFVFLSRIEWIEGFLNCEPHAIVLPGGKILVHIRIQQSDCVFTTYQSESRDDGKTFTKPHPIGLPSGAPSHILRHSSGILIASYGYRTAPFGQRVMFSADDGESWDTDYILRDDGPSPDLGYPMSVELDNGDLLTVYYQQEPGKSNCVIMQSVWSLPEAIQKGVRR